MGKEKITREQKVSLTKDYPILTKEELLLKYNIPWENLQNIARKSGNGRRRLYNKMLILSDSEILYRYKNGISANEISKVCGVDCHRILNILKRYGTIQRSLSESCRTYKIREDYFDNIDTERKAYFLGLLYADGNNFLERGRVSINLHYQDKEILEKMRDDIFTEKHDLSYIKEKTVINKKNGKIFKSNPQYRLYICNKHISKRLNELGMVPNKSLILEYPKFLKKELENHFIRGYFDGDGSICNVENKRISFSLVGTEDFVTNIQKLLIENCLVTKTKLDKAGSSGCIKKLIYVGRLNCLKIRDFLYRGESISLKRKKERFFNIRGV